MNAKYQQIINTPLPAFRAKIRNLSRKERAAHVKSLLKSVGLGWVSVTAPNYSMAQAIHIRFNQPEDGKWETSEHGQEHARIDEQERGNGAWLGYGHYCPHCKQKHQAHVRLEKIILAAFPDLDDRSETQSDYFDYCLSID